MAQAPFVLTQNMAFFQELMTCGMQVYSWTYSPEGELQVLGHTMYEDFIQRVHKIRIDPSLSQQIQACCDYIQLHPEEPLDAKSLAERVGYAPYYLTRKFRQETGFTVGEYIRIVRVERAKTLLAYSDQPISKIAADLRFSSSSHFSDNFKAITGILPQDYRKQTQKK